MEKQRTVHMVDVPALQIPPFRHAIAQQKGIKKLLLTTWGGLGDVVCAEPTLRYAFKLFKDWDISLLTSFPELFTHLPFKEVLTRDRAKEVQEREDEFLIIHTNPPENNMGRDFITHHFTQVVDFSSLCAFQRQLPIHDRWVNLKGSDAAMHSRSVKVLIHPGRHWQSKTFPKPWWDEVIAGLAASFPHQVGIIGKDVDRDTGTVDVEVPEGVFDFRNKQSLPDLISLLKAAEIVVTNDSAPLHIAAAGFAHILFLASCKEPDHLTHWRFNSETRRVEWGWRMKNLGRDGLWNYKHSNPVRTDELTINHMDPEIITRLLPPPDRLVAYARMLR